MSIHMGLTVALLTSAATLTAPPLAAAQLDRDAQSPAAVNELEEIIVTATKRPQSVREIAGSVSALSGVELDKLGAQSMADYITRTPGVVFNGNTPGNSTATIRGISTTTGIDQGQGTTGYFLDDVPLTDPFFAIAIPDIDAFDVQNVVVLRGPQGTLFGSASLGGAINYQTTKPDPARWDTRVQGTFASVEEGGSAGSGRVMLNAPLVTDKFALRGVYVYREDPGFIDNVGTAKKDVNQSLTRGGRVQALWTPTDSTTISYLFLDQTQETKDSGYQAPLEAGSLEKNTVIAEHSDFETLIHNLRVDQNLGFATLTVAGAYHEKTQDSIDDATADLQDLFPLSPITIAQPATSRGKTFEIRLASPSGRQFEYLVGAMYDETRMNIYNIAQAAGAADFIENVLGPILGLPPGIGAISAPDDVFLNALIPVHGKEAAVFGEGTFSFNDQWKLTVGGRAFETKVTNETIASGFFSLLTAGELETHLTGPAQKESGFLPKVSVTWTPSDAFMAYALRSEGFRYGGPNIVTSEPGFEVPSTFGSDSLVNYELGVRSTIFDRRLQLDGTLFYIDWSDIQLRQQTPLGANFAVNAGKASSSGVEGSLTWLMSDALRFAANVTYLDAELSEDFVSNPGGGTPVGVSKGATLPGASKWQVSDSLSYEWSAAALRPSFLLAHRYISEAPSGVLGSDAKQGDYHVLDARVSVQFNRIGITAFASNVTDERGVTTASNDPLQQFLVTPRTIGISVDYRL